MLEEQEPYLQAVSAVVWLGEIMNDIPEIVSRLRNRNVAQLLDDIGEQPPMIVRSIKRQFTRFANDTVDAIQEIQDDGKYIKDDRTARLPI